MAQEMELSELSATRPGAVRGQSGDPGRSAAERRLLRVGFLALAVLCILQAALNVSLRLSLNSREGSDEFPCDSSVIAGLCRIDPSEQISGQLCSCYNRFLGNLLAKNESLKNKDDVTPTPYTELESGSGSGSWDAIPDQE